MKMKTGFTEAAPFVCALLACLQTVKGWSEPAFCHGYECPRFELEQENEEINFQERSYVGSHWVRIAIPALTSKDLKDGYYKLEGYFNGNNEKNLTLPLTKPVATTILNLEETEKYFVSFFVPPGTDLPKFNDPSFTEEYIPAGRMYVRDFGGFPGVQKYLDNLEELKAALTSAGKTYSHSRAMALAYDGVLTIFNRHDEVWIPAD